MGGGVFVNQELVFEDSDDEPLAIRRARLNLSLKLKISSTSPRLDKPLGESTPNAQKLKKVNEKSKKIMKKSKELPNLGDRRKWTTLVHNGVIFPPPYRPHGVRMLYDGKPVDLTPEQEEVATMYAAMLDTDYVKKGKFNKNFFNDWKKLLGRNHVIQDLKKCDFRPIHEWHLCEKEKTKAMSTEEKKAWKEEKLKQEKKFMWAIVDGVKQKVGNFRVEPPGLFMGRGEHPKMGKFRRRIYPSDITVNIGKDAPIPECPIPGQSWKEIIHDNTATWIACWNDPIYPKEVKYVFLDASSTLKGQSNKEKYEKSRKLKDDIRAVGAAYTEDSTIKDMTERHIALVTSLIDRLALRVGPMINSIVVQPCFHQQIDDQLVEFLRREVAAFSLDESATL